MNYARERLRFYMSAQLNYQLAAALSPVAGGGCRSSWPIKALARPGQRVIQRPRGARAGRRWGSGRNAGGRCGKRSEEHTSELQSLMRISYAVFCLKKKKQNHN